jgi:hypothetical protein
MEHNLPATRPDPDADLDRARPPRRQPLSVAFLPLALIAFILLAIAIAAWTFLAASPGA